MPRYNLVATLCNAEVSVSDTGAAQRVLTGERERAPDLAAIRAALEGRVFAAQLRDETRLKQDIWAKAGQGTLRGLFLSELRAQYEAAETPAERERVTMAARWGLAALDHDEEVFAL